MKKYDTLLSTAKWLGILFGSLFLVWALFFLEKKCQTAHYNAILTEAIQSADADSIVNFNGQLMSVDYARTLYK